jgi:ABC-type lipoprotein export system ATPase subunit
MVRRWWKRRLLGETATADAALDLVFQFFQLLLTLTLVENVMLPMDFCGMYHPSERRKRVLELLGLVGMADQADKLPSVVSGGQHQRAVIAHVGKRSADSGGR